MLKQFRVLPCLGTMLLVAASLPEAQPPQANLIHVEITGLRDDKGQVLCTLYSSPAGFLHNSSEWAERDLFSVRPSFLPSCYN